MGQSDSSSGVRERRRAWRAGGQQQLALWPQGPLAAVLALIGILNIIGGLKLPLPVILRTHTVSNLADSLSALGGLLVWLAVVT